MGVSAVGIPNDTIDDKIAAGLLSGPSAKTLPSAKFVGAVSVVVGRGDRDHDWSNRVILVRRLPALDTATVRLENTPQARLGVFAVSRADFVDELHFKSPVFYHLILLFVLMKQLLYRLQGFELGNLFPNFGVLSEQILHFCPCLRSLVAEAESAPHRGPRIRERFRLVGNPGALFVGDPCRVEPVRNRQAVADFVEFRPFGALHGFHRVWLVEVSAGGALELGLPFCLGEFWIAYPDNLTPLASAAIDQ
jgi:hypothetical protein